MRKKPFETLRTTFNNSVIVIALLLSACGSSTPIATSQPQQAVASSTPIPTDTTSPTNPPKPTDTSAPTIAPSPTATSMPTSAPQQAVQPTSLDPCQLISSQEASSLAGASFGEGVEDTNPGGGRSCTYGSQTTNVFIVEVVQAPDKATVDTAKSQFLNDLKSKMPELASAGVQVTQLPNFADGAIFGQLSLNIGGATINGSSFGFTKGTIFVGFSDLAVGSTAPSSTAMQSEATTVLGRLP